MQNTNTATRPTFARIAATAAVKGFVKEAKNVGYTVIVNRGDDFDGKGKGPIWGYEVKDGEAMVFKATALRPNMWGMLFSTVYWKEPAI